MQFVLTEDEIRNDYDFVDIIQKNKIHILSKIYFQYKFTMTFRCARSVKDIARFNNKLVHTFCSVRIHCN